MNTPASTIARNAAPSTTVTPHFDIQRLIADATLAASLPVSTLAPINFNGLYQTQAAAGQGVITASLPDAGA